MQLFKDQLNRTIFIEQTPKRIVSLVPSQTELLCDLGLESSLVGITKFCIHPRGLRSKISSVGGTKQINIDELKALKPDLILCNKEENTEAIVRACEMICNVHVSDVFSIENTLELIRQYGEMFNKNKEAQAIINKIEAEMASFKAFVQGKPSLQVAYFIWKDPWMVAGNNTFINHLLQLNKFENIYNSLERYPEIILNESTKNNEAQVVLLSSEPYPFKERHKSDVQGNFPNSKIILVDGELFSWHGSRLSKAFSYFKKLRLNLENSQLY